MKKMISGLFAAVLLAAGLVGVSGGTAQADCTPTIYTGCVNTVTLVKAPNRDVARNHVARIRIRVEAVNSNAEVTGKVKVVVRRVKDGQKYFRETKAYEGGKLVFITPELKFRGLYTVTAKFTPTEGSVFNSSNGSDTFRVVRKS